MNLDESECLGCMCIFPSTDPKYDALIYMWVRESEVKYDLDGYFYEIVKKWINEKWPFKNPNYPRR